MLIAWKPKTIKEGNLTSMTHGPVAELRPVIPGSKESIIGNHRSVMAPPAPSAFRTPFPVSLKKELGVRAHSHSKTSVSLRQSMRLLGCPGLCCSHTRCALMDYHLRAKHCPRAGGDSAEGRSTSRSSYGCRQSTDHLTTCWGSRRVCGDIIVQQGVRASDWAAGTHAALV